MSKYEDDYPEYWIEEDEDYQEMEDAYWRAQEARAYNAWSNLFPLFDEDYEDDVSYENYIYNGDLSDEEN